MTHGEHPSEEALAMATAWPEILGRQLIQVASFWSAHLLVIFR